MGSCEREGGEERRRGRCPKCNEMPALRQTKGTRRLTRRPRRRGRAQPERCRGLWTAAQLTLHLSADRGAAAPGSAAAAAASTQLRCDREGRLVLTARGDWQAPAPLRSLDSPERGSARPIPTAKGCARAQRMECVVQPRARPAPLQYPGKVQANACAHTQALRVGFRKFTNLK